MNTVFSLPFCNSADPFKYYMDEFHILLTNVFFLKVKCSCGILIVDNDLFNKDIQRLSRVKNSLKKAKHFSIFALKCSPCNSILKLKMNKKILSVIRIQTPLLSLQTCTANV